MPKKTVKKKEGFWQRFCCCDDSMGGEWLAVGVGIGVALGVGMDNLAAGIGVGVAIGIALGAGQKKKGGKHGKKERKKR